MPKLIPVSDALSKPFWDAVNQRRLVLQHCAACDAAGSGRCLHLGKCALMRGTEGSNPAPSSAESAANLTSSLPQKLLTL